MMSSKTKQYEMDMCSGPILRKMLMFALPLMLSSILQLLFNAADIVVVGKFAGDNSLAAVGSNTALINLLTNLFIGLSIGANVVAARHYGAKAWDDLRRTVHTAMLLSMLSGALLLVLGVIGAEQMLIWMQTPEEVLPLATVYLRIYFLGMISTMVYNFGSALLRAVGDTKRPLYFLLCAGISRPSALYTRPGGFCGAFCTFHTGLCSSTGILVLPVSAGRHGQCQSTHK